MPTNLRSKTPIKCSYAAASDKNYLRTETTADDNAKATISITSGEATITFQGTNTRNIMRYNPNTQFNAPLFACYSSSSTVGSLPKIYREATSTVITSFPEVNNDEPAVKFFLNGRLYIRRAGIIYDALGRIVR